MNSSSPLHPTSLHLFFLLPQPLIERILCNTSLSAKDLSALRSAACHAGLPLLASATEVAAAIRVYAHPNGPPLLDNKFPSETHLSLLTYLELLDNPAVTQGPTEVWTCGRNDLGQGVRPSHTDLNSIAPCYRLPSDLFNFDKPAAVIIFLAAGSHHSVAVSELGAMYVAGANYRGQLGLSDFAFRSAWTPVLDLTAVRVAQVACGASHTVVLTADGGVLTTGANEFGQLGLRDRKLRACFSQVQLSHARMIAAGSAHTVVLLENGVVHGTGSNSRGQLGGKPYHGRCGFLPIGCFDRKVVRIACGADTTMLLTVDNMVLVTGKRHCGLSVIGGLGMSRVTHLSVAEGFAVVRTARNEVAVSTHRKRFEVTEELQNMKASSVSSGLAHYAIPMNDGSAFAAGTNTFGQVAAGEMGLTLEGSENARIIRPYRIALSRVHIPPGYRVLRAACGMFHTLYLLEKERGDIES